MLFNFSMRCIGYLCHLVFEHTLLEVLHLRHYLRVRLWKIVAWQLRPPHVYQMLPFGYLSDSWFLCFVCLYGCMFFICVSLCNYCFHGLINWHSLLIVHCTVKKKMLGYLKILSQPAKADFWVFSTYFLGNVSTFCCINLKQEVEKTQKSAEAGCFKILSLPNFFYYSVW